MYSRWTNRSLMILTVLLLIFFNLWSESGGLMGRNSKGWDKYSTTTSFAIAVKCPITFGFLPLPGTLCVRPGLFVGLFLSSSRIIKKLLNRLPQNMVEGWTQAKKETIWGRSRIIVSLSLAPSTMYKFRELDDKNQAYLGNWHVLEYAI